MFVTRTNHSATSMAASSATVDAKTISAMNEPSYSSADKFKGELVERLVAATFYKSSIFKVYRKNFIAIKACDPSNDELISDECRKLYDTCHSQNVQVVHTNTGVIFRVFKS